MSLLLPDLGLLFWMTLSFGAVFFVVARYGFPVIVRSVENRKRYIDESVSKADEANKLLVGIQAEKESMLDETRAQRSAMVAETVKTREQLIADAKEAARKEAAVLMEEARKQIRMEQEAAMADFRSQVAFLAVDIAEKVLRSELKDKGLQLELVNRLLDEARLESPGS